MTEVINQHHLAVTIKLGCGCELEQRISGEDLMHMIRENAEELGVEVPEKVTFPSGFANMFGMISSLYNPLLLHILFSEDHEDKGNETIDIRVRTKVGELPTPEDWRRKN